MDSDFHADEALRRVREHAARLTARIDRHAARLEAEHNRDRTAATAAAGGAR
ncbi:hypothetical protein [Kitasatospora sp. DSM 101779]|uniref:hypothetical protein n=1 Tax=Kitasatospora sp. DSM 101779 TaxID=2853165 RepID=UPI0021D94B42|nr:hypothetical protein [Kitasatospora sp. DSM 101779]MCU7822197.1 hypothetical protein [Kitasatospora sp. DSM 101779]